MLHGPLYSLRAYNTKQQPSHGYPHYNIIQHVCRAISGNLFCSYRPKCETIHLKMSLHLQVYFNANQTHFQKKTKVLPWKRIKCFSSTLPRSFWIWVWRKLGQKNHIIDVTPSFSKSSRRFPSQENEKPAFLNYSGVKSVLEKLRSRVTD